MLAIGLTPGAYTATDGSNGVPYVLVRGADVKPIGPISLSPSEATNDLGTTHTVCATISTNNNPFAGVLVTFTISSGPNSVTNYTTLTGTNGVACFTYTGNGGLGTDFITATFTNNGVVVSSPTVSKLWVGTCINVGCPALQCTADGTWTYSFCVTNLGSFPLTAVSLFNAPAGVGPSAVVAADLNGDGRADLAVTNWSDRTVSVLLSGANGTFGSAQAFPTIERPSSIAAGDFNGDGKTDLVTADPNNSWDWGPSTVLLGNGDGTFQTQNTWIPAPPPLPAGESPLYYGATRVVVADVNADGRPDLLNLVVEIKHLAHCNLHIVVTV